MTQPRSDEQGTDPTAADDQPPPPDPQDRLPTQGSPRGGPLHNPFGGDSPALSPADRGEDGSQPFIAVTVVLIAITRLLFTGRRVQHSMERDASEAAGSQNTPT